MRRLALLLVAVLMTAACPLPIRLPSASTGTITISVASAGRSASRTVVTDFTKQIDEIEVDLHSNDGYADPAAAFCSAEPWQVTVTQVPVGSWNIHAIARKGGVQVATADQNGLTLTAGVPLSVPITLSFTAAAMTGSVQFTVSFPDSVGIDYVQGVLQETSDTSEPALSSAGGYTSGTFQFSNLPTGTYSLVMTFRRGGPTGSSAGIFREKVVVLGGFQSSGWVNSSGGLDSRRTFAANEFLEGNASLSGLVVTNTFTSGFDSGLYIYVGNPIPDATVTFTATASISNEYIQYVWNGTGPIEIVSGTPSAALSTGASNTLQVHVTAPDRQTTHDYTVTFARGYSLTYHSNGATSGSAPVDSAYRAAGAVVGVSANTGLLVRPGLSFAGWNTAADGSGVTYYPGTAFPMPASDTDLYACWGPVPRMQNLVAQVTDPYTIRVTWTTPPDPSIVQSTIDWGSGSFMATYFGPYQYDYQFTSGTTNTLITFTVTARDIGGNPLAVGTVSAFCADSASYPTGTGYSIPYGSGTLNFEVDASGNITIDGSSAGVTDLVIPSSIAGHTVTALADYVSSSGLQPTTVVIPDSVTSVGRSAFESRSLTNIVFPSHLTSLGPNAFRGCMNLASVNLPPGVNVPDGGFMGCSALSSLSIPEGLTYIGSNGFSGSSLTSVSIPSTVTMIGWAAFASCTHLQTVNIYATIPPTLDNVNPPPFIADSALTAIYVPAASVTAYKSAPVWVDNYAPLIQAGTW